MTVKPDTFDDAVPLGEIRSAIKSIGDAVAPLNRAARHSALMTAHAALMTADDIQLDFAITKLRRLHEHILQQKTNGGSQRKVSKTLVHDLSESEQIKMDGAQLAVHKLLIDIGLSADMIATIFLISFVTTVREVLQNVSTEDAHELLEHTFRAYDAILKSKSNPMLS